VAGAQQLLLQLAGSEPGNANIQALLGHCFESLRQPELALQSYQRAVELDPSQVGRYEDLILFQLELGRTSEAMSLANRLISVAPGDARLWVLKGNVELRANAFQDALNSYTHASKLDRFNADAVLGLAGVHSLSGASSAAIADYQAGIQRFPTDARFYVAFAAALLASTDAPQTYPQVKSLLQQAVRLDSRSPDAHYQLGQLALRQGQLSEAKTEFLASLQGDPNRSNTHFALSLAYRRMGQTDDAAKHFSIYGRLKQAEERGSLVTERVSKP
jgi:tetratricopeptide (TPR) repeat protein